MATTLIQKLRAAEAALVGPERFLDLRLELRDPEGKKLLVAGGRWDQVYNRFLDPQTEGRAAQSVVIRQQESQLEVIRWAAEWLCDFREGLPRNEQVAFLAGDRRGGKTFAGIELMVAGCIDVPIMADGTPLVAAIVAKSFRERFEIEEWIKARIPVSTSRRTRPDAWARHHAAPEHSFEFVHGPILRLLSADDPDALKQGRYDLVFVNEPQKIAARGIAHVVMGAADNGGLTILAANPPRDSRGEWMFDLKDALDDERVALAQGKPVDALGVRYFHVDSKKNAAIDQLARRRAGRIATLIDPSLTAGDVEGVWRRPQDRACWEFDKHRHLHAVPAMGVVDVTGAVTRRRGLGEWPTVAGVDFQDKPHIVATWLRCFGDVDDPTFWFVGGLAGERRWTEEEYLDAFADRFPEYTIRDLLWVGDSSGSWQDAPHSRGGRTSFQIWKDRHWRMIPPQDPKSKEREARARNPFVDDQLQLVNELLRRDKIRIDPVTCPWLAECFREAITKRETGRRKIVQTKHAHALASALYALWRLAGGRRGGVGVTPRAGSFPGSRLGAGFAY